MLDSYSEAAGVGSCSVEVGIGLEVDMMGILFGWEEVRMIGMGLGSQLRLEGAVGYAVPSQYLELKRGGRTHLQDRGIDDIHKQHRLEQSVRQLRLARQ